MATSGAAAGFGDAAVVLGEAAAVIRARLSSERELPVVRPDQSWQLEERFGECHNPAPSDIVLIAAEVGISEAQTVVWFRHRLALWRRKQGLPANFVSVKQ